MTASPYHYVNEDVYGIFDVVSNVSFGLYTFVTVKSCDSGLDNFINERLDGKTFDDDADIYSSIDGLIDEYETSKYPLLAYGGLLQGSN